MPCNNSGLCVYTGFKRNKSALFYVMELLTLKKAESYCSHPDSATFQIRYCFLLLHSIFDRTC